MPDNDTGEIKAINGRILERLNSIDRRLEIVEGKLDRAVIHTTRCAERWDRHVEKHIEIDTRMESVEGNVGWRVAIGTSLAAGVTAVLAWLRQ